MPSEGKQTAQHPSEDGHNIVDVPVVSAPPALILELDPPLRGSAAAAASAARPLDGLTFAVSDVYVALPAPDPISAWMRLGVSKDRALVAARTLHAGCSSDTASRWPVTSR